MSNRLRSLISGPASALLVIIMIAGCLFLWIGIPLGWLWIGSQVQGAASLGAAMAITMAGVTLTILATVTALAWLNRKHAELRVSRREGRGEVATVGSRRYDRQSGGALEPMLVISAGVSLVLFAIWFFGFAGASPVPLNLGF